MNYLARLMLFVALGSSAVAQTTTTGSTTGTTSGTSNIGGSNTPSSGFSGVQMEGAPTISGGGTTGANVNSSNAFSLYYANPYYSGRPGTTGTDAPGGFGTPLAGGSSTGNRNASSVTSRTSGSSGTASRSTGGISTGGTSTGSSASRSTGSSTPSIGGTTAGQGFGSGLGGTTGTANRGGFGGTSTSGFGQQSTRNSGGFGTTNRGGTQNSGVVATQARQVSTSLRIPANFNTVSPVVMQGDLRNAINRSSFISNAGGITITHEGSDVVLQGTVKDEEEARTAEGIVRLTPGVRDVKNELKYPNP